MRFNGTVVHTEDLEEAKPGSRYFVVSEKRVRDGRTCARLQSLPPVRLGALRASRERGPAITRELLGLGQVVAVGESKVLRPVPESEHPEVMKAATDRKQALEEMIRTHEGNRAY